MIMRIAMGLLLYWAAQHANAGPVGGAKHQADVVGAFSSVTYAETFYGGEWSSVTVVGDGDTDLDLFVYDSLGNLIASDTDHTDACWVTFRPYFTGDFVIEVVNLGGVYNRFQISAR